LVIHVVSLTEERMVKTAVIPFSTIGNVEFEYEVVNGENREEMCIHFNSNCTDLTIRTTSIERLCVRIIGCGDNDIEAVTIKAFEKEFIKAMTKYVMGSDSKKIIENKTDVL
jgi:hypothetical protein